MTDLFCFPSYEQMYVGELRRLKRFRQYVRYHIARIRCKNEIIKFEKFINENPLYIELFNENLYKTNTVLYKYCDQSFSNSERVEAVIQGLSIALNFFGQNLVETLLKEQSIRLFEFRPDLVLYLNINRIDPLEGFFSLSLQNEQDEHIYDASFSFIKPNSLLIASIQGSNKANASDLIRQATKDLYGIRPAFMLVDVFKMICKLKNFSLFGIPKKNQVKVRLIHTSKMLFDYDNFWSENQANFTGKYYELPVELEIKSLEDVKTRKRSMYKKRYELLDRMQNDLKQFLNN